MASRKLEIARGKHVLESVFDGKDFDSVFHYAVVYPPAAVLADHLPVLRTFHAGEGLYAKLGICWKHRGCVGCIVREGDGVLGVEVDGDVANRVAKACGSTFGPVRGRRSSGHLAILWRALAGGLAFFGKLFQIGLDHALDFVVGVHFAALRLALGD